MPTTDTPIDETLLYEHWTCPHWEYFRQHAGHPGVKRHQYAPELLLNDLLPEFEKKAMPKPFVEAKGKSLAARLRATAKHMKAGAQRIWRPVLVSENFLAQPDYLERRDDASSDLGNYYYVAVDFKNVERPNPGHRAQAGLYAELLERTQGRAPDEGYISTLPFPAIIGLPISQCRQAFREALEEIQAIRGGEQPAPYISSGCKQSPWFAQCLELAIRRDDIALLYNIRESAMRKLRQNGIATLADIRVMDPRSTARVTGIPEEVLERHKLQAQCLKDQVYLFREKPELPTAEVEVCFDIEGDPMRPAEYLFGMLIRQNGGEAVYEKILATTPGREKLAWKQLLAWLDKLPETGLAVYHFGSYEISRLSLLAQKYGGSPAVDRFRAAMVDLAEVVKGSVILPLHFYSLKDIGRYLGIDRGSDISTGGESVSWYEEWLKTKNRKKLDTIVEYNRDDVVATQALKDWLAKIH